LFNRCKTVALARPDELKMSWRDIGPVAASSATIAPAPAGTWFILPALRAVIAMKSLLRTSVSEVSNTYMLIGVQSPWLGSWLRWMCSSGRLGSRDERSVMPAKPSAWRRVRLLGFDAVKEW